MPDLYCVCKEMDVEDGGLVVCQNPPTQEDLLCDTCREGCQALLEITGRDANDLVVKQVKKHVRFDNLKTEIA